MKAIIAGGTGMVGELVLENCLNSSKITEVVSLVRKPTGQSHDKLKEVVVDDFTEYRNHQEVLQGADMAFFCIGVYTGQVPDDKFKEITVDYAVKFGEAIKASSTNANFCLLSGAGADRTEKSRTAFARYKGMSENQLDDLGLNFTSFRPGYIYPVTPRDEPNWMYKISRFIYPAFRLLGKGASITSVELADAMFKVGVEGTAQTILENKEIHTVLDA
ncbi:MAG: NAD(P)H-binding protein [Flavobacteriales bacterium]|nr:NAD(P)H-binding protein [Flavobacteriales bacterium]MDG1781165.1 NAD(P)H-binding protein [Flavobacteriales bacterium]MDG2245575.1 NAD(P)H-binding protein [Flavobacteriales bacterium]